MGNKKDITGMKFNMWTVLECVGKNRFGSYLWKCRCDCGTERIVEGRSVRTGTSRGCGCTRGRNNKRNLKHGGKGERLYGVWSSMKGRCLNPNDTYYDRYGGRGIRIYDDWMSYENFRDWALTSGYDKNAPFRSCTIDRIDNDGDYRPDNCRWVTQKEQDNNRSSNHIITNSAGESRTLSEWAELTGIRKDTLRRRICVMNWDIDRALTEPVHRARI